MKVDYRTLSLLDGPQICYENKLVFLRSVHRLLLTASVVPSSPILVNLMMEALRSSETSVLTRATQRNIPEDTILHSHRRENLKSCYENSFATRIRNEVRGISVVSTS
jgi:hypothetical protein